MTASATMPAARIIGYAGAAAPAAGSA
jgi:hypothetical protein